jgi:methyl-accepting chemotaxis protein
MTLPAFFSRISSKLALMSGIGILMVLAMLMTGWLSNRTVGENAMVERQQMGASRDYVDAKASVRGMQIAMRDLRLAGSAAQAAEAYNGQQGDPWDAQKDMALAGLGA